MDFPSLEELLLRIPPLLFALTIHEYAHAWMAYRCGDPTARDRGRLTLHPLVHLDPIGTLCLLFAPFGWAKPVPVNPANFRHPKWDDILVSLAGVTVNLATAVAVALLLRLLLAAGIVPGSSRPMLTLWFMAQMLVILSVGLAIFNLFPIPPLDGSHVLAHLLPRDMAIAYERMAPVMSLAFLFLIISGAVRHVLIGPLAAVVNLLLGPLSPFLGP